MRIGLLGGSFDPPHMGHLMIAEEARWQCNLDIILFMVTSHPPHKGEPEAGPDPKIIVTQNKFHNSDLDIEIDTPVTISVTVTSNQFTNGQVVQGGARPPSPAISLSKWTTPTLGCRPSA